MAAEMGHIDCMKLLLDGYADCNISTKYSKHGSYTGIHLSYWPKSAIEHAQNVQIQIIPLMHKESSGPLLSIHIFNNIQ